MAASEDLLLLLDKEIPEGRKSLQENYVNLDNVAKYCEANYFKASVAQKSQALEETKNYTTHSLASVAYQINSLATNFMKMLDLQLGQLADMESSVNHLNQMVMIHKEKVARREIGVLTVSKIFPKHLSMKNGIIYPEQTERPSKYVRTAIDYTVLDSVGHGLRPQGGISQIARSPSVSSTSSSQRNSQAPTTKPPATPIGQMGSASGAGNRASGGNYRTPAPSAAPPAPPAAAVSAALEPSPSALPPPVDSEFPPLFMDPVSPPLPPPPMDDDQMGQFDFSDSLADLNSNIKGRYGVGDGSMPPGTYATSTRSHEDPYAATGSQLMAQASLVPAQYLEKVVAIYDYQAVKPDELSFAENAVIYVINKNDDGWWEGVMEGHTGLFPYNYVEPCM
ncbi:unnamed protein product [Candidula unifasciata]|uniref:SH3 domain-containing protein n=1 Tax=Candidula unifasciata TaxID=100452 RepID=A0A8S3ZGN0_9EUPU|nr:unnamed protein product [Candidula unifasciata]